MYSSVALLSFAGLLLWWCGEHGTQLLFPQNFCGCEVVAQVLDTPYLHQSLVHNKHKEQGLSYFGGDKVSVA